VDWLTHVGITVEVRSKAKGLWRRWAELIQLHE